MLYIVLVAYSCSNPNCHEKTHKTLLLFVCLYGMKISEPCISINVYVFMAEQQQTFFAYSFRSDFATRCKRYRHTPQHTDLDRNSFFLFYIIVSEVK